MKTKYTQEDFFRYFRDEYGEKEKMELDSWIAQSPANAEAFRNARILFDAVLMHSDASWLEKDSGHKAKSGKSRILVKKIAFALANIAAVVGLFFVANEISERKLNDELAETVLKIEVPKGQRMDFTLADGTTVHLNSGAEFSYPVRFSDRKRNVSLTGEAYFSVAPDKSKPFVINTFAGDVTVLGTEFNVYADPEEKEFVTSVVSGKVSVADIYGGNYLLEKGCELSIKGKEIRHSHTDTKIRTRWMDGIITIDSSDFRKLMGKFEKAYGVRIVIEREEIPAMDALRGSLRIAEGIDYALSIVQEVSDFSYIKEFNDDGAVVIKIQ